jgi:hypothetical protein
MVQTVSYGAAQPAAIRMPPRSPPHSRRKTFVRASLAVALVCVCVALVSFGLSSSTVDDDELLSK